MNSKAQTMFAGFALFAFIIIGLLVLSPFLLKVWNTAIPAFGAAVGNQSVQAGETVNYVRTTYISTFDSVVMGLFLILFIVLIFSSFLIDVSPFFVVLYIIDGVLFFALAPAVSPILDALYGSSQFAIEQGQLPAMTFLANNFWPVILGVYAFSGLIIFVKLRFFPSR